MGWFWKRKEPDQVLTGDPALRREILDQIIKRRIDLVNEIEDTLGAHGHVASEASRIVTEAVDDFVLLEQKLIAAYLREHEHPLMHAIANGITPFSNGLTAQRVIFNG